MRIQALLLWTRHGELLNTRMEGRSMILLLSSNLDPFHQLCKPHKARVLPQIVAYCENVGETCILKARVRQVVNREKKVLPVKHALQHLKMIPT